MSKENKKCAHPACSCTAENDSKYCSQYCKDAGRTTEISCNCGHEGCSVSDSIPGGTMAGKA